MLHGNHFQLDESYRWYVNDERPDQAQYRAQRRNVFKVEGVEIDLATQASIDSDRTHFHITFSNVLKRNGTLVRERTWVDQIPRHYQ